MRYKMVLKDSDDYDYKTEYVKGSDIFDINTTGTTGPWQDLAVGRDTDYYKNKKNLKGSIVQMTPNEYYQNSAKVFQKLRGSNSSPEDLKSQRASNKENIDYLKKVILEKKKKFPLCVIDISHNPGQEGLHRMMVAGELFGWNTKFPVLLVETYDKARQEIIEKNYAQHIFESKVERVLDIMENYEYYDKEEFYEMLTEKLEYYNIEDVILTENGNELEISKYDDDIDDTLIYNYNMSNIRIGD